MLDEVKKTEPTVQNSTDERSDSYGASVNNQTLSLSARI